MTPAGVGRILRAVQGSTHYGAARDVARILGAIGEISREYPPPDPGRTAAASYYEGFSVGWREACIRIAMELVAGSPDPEVRALLIQRFREAQEKPVDTPTVPGILAP